MILTSHIDIKQTIAVFYLKHCRFLGFNENVYFYCIIIVQYKQPAIALHETYVPVRFVLFLPFYDFIGVDQQIKQNACMNAFNNLRKLLRCLTRVIKQQPWALFIKMRSSRKWMTKQVKFSFA